MLFCPLHRKPLLDANGGKCPDCERLGIEVATCELDKQSRAIDTLLEQGYEIDFQRSHCVIVFYKKTTL